VPDYPQCVEAAAVAHRVPGVGCVRNHLEIALSPGDYRDDQTLTTMANDALTLDHEAPMGVVGVRAAAKNGDDPGYGALPARSRVARWGPGRP